MTNEIDVQMAAKGVKRSAIARALGITPAAVTQTLNGTTRSQRVINEVARAIDWTPAQVCAFIPQKSKGGK